MAGSFIVFVSVRPQVAKELAVGLRHAHYGPSARLIPGDRLDEAHTHG